MEDKTFFEDFRKFQDECPVIPLNAEASFPTKKGGLFKFKYADLASILKVVRPVLSKNNLLVYWKCKESGAVKCVLEHTPSKLEDISLVKNKNKRTSTVMIKSNDDPKTQGAAITYAKRYSLVALLGIVAEEDKDAPPEEKKSMSAKAFGDACERIKRGDNDVIKQCLLFFNVTEQQKDKLVELEFKYNG